ncbi:MAG: hypothetical protein IPN33_25955 [Saprospiraceae bacterium]|nr:hypothetical protein [Saprospiraceae bacterium]
MQKDMKRVFDRPTPFTINNSLYIKPSTRDDLQAEVWLKGDGMYESSKATPAVKYLSPEIFGGPRQARSSELDLRRAGYLESDMFTVPGAEFRAR